MLYFCHTPKLGPARVMLIETLCYYRGCYYRGSTVVEEKRRYMGILWVFKPKFQRRLYH